MKKIYGMIHLANNYVSQALRESDIYAKDIEVFN